MGSRTLSLRCWGVEFVCRLNDCPRLVAEIALSVASAMLAVILLCVLPGRLDFVLEFALSFLLTLSIGSIFVFPCMHVDSLHCIKTPRNTKRSGNPRGDRSQSWDYDRRNSEVPAGRATADERATAPAADEIEINEVYSTVKDEVQRESGDYAEIYDSVASYHSKARAGPSTSRRAPTASGESISSSLNSKVDGDFP